jgi:hypothetical protein
MTVLPSQESEYSSVDKAGEREPTVVFQPTEMVAHHALILKRRWKCIFLQVLNIRRI